MRFVFALAVLFTALATPAAQAEVAHATPSAVQFHFQAETTAAPDRAWRALGDIGHWWNSDHTWSGDARNLRLDVRAGGCWCERWAHGQVEHMRVVTVMEHEGQRTLRLAGGLGPLQEMGVTGVMTFTIAHHSAGSTITMDYRVAGDSSLSLDQIAPGVDHVLSEQFDRLIRYTGTGSAG
jgi:uncharacterized protein YndB with AHSA1/START domain